MLLADILLSHFQVEFNGLFPIRFDAPAKMVEGG